MVRNFMVPSSTAAVWKSELMRMGNYRIQAGRVETKEEVKFNAGNIVQRVGCLRRSE